MNSARYYWLDWIRFLCALVVVVIHIRSAVFVDYGALEASSKGLSTLAFFAATRFGHEAVMFFFVLSGFFVGGSLLQKWNDGSLSVSDYAIDRLSRIYVPLVPILLLISLKNIYYINEIDVIGFFGNLFSLQGVLVDIYGGNGPLWSLSYEVWFYIAAGSIYVLLKDGNERNKVISIVFILLFVLVFTQLNPVYILTWCFGALVYKHKKSSRNVLHFILSSLLLVMSLLASQLTSESKSLPFDVSEFRWVSDLILSISIVYFVQHVRYIEPRGVFAKLESRGTFWASFSYTLYLSHYPMMHVLVNEFGLGGHAEVNASTLFEMCILVVVCIFVAYLLYLPFEKNTNKIRAYLKARKSSILQVSARV